MDEVRQHPRSPTSARDGLRSPETLHRVSDPPRNPAGSQPPSGKPGEAHGRHRLLRPWSRSRRLATVDNIIESVMYPAGVLGHKVAQSNPRSLIYGCFDECCQEGLVPEVGDQIQLTATKVDQASRSGVVTHVRGRMITVQWAAGHQSVFVPAPGTLTVLGRAGARPRKATIRARASRSARAAIPAQPSSTKKTLAKKAPVRKTAKNGVAKAAATRATPKAPVPKAAKRPTAPKRTTITTMAARKAPVRKAAKRPTAPKRTTVTKRSPRKRVR